MENRREFFKKAGMVAGLGAAGAVTLKKGYIKPVIRALEPSYAEAVTPMVSAGTLSQTGDGEVDPSATLVFTTRFTLEIGGATVAPAGVAADVRFDWQLVADAAPAGYPASANETLEDLIDTDSNGEMFLGVNCSTDPANAVDRDAVVTGIGTAGVGNFAGCLGLLGMSGLNTTGDAAVLKETFKILAATIFGVSIPATTLSAITFDLENA